MPGRNQFINPADGTTYDWDLNHEGEEPAGKTRVITRTANTGNVGAVRQEGDDGSYTLQLTGRIEKRAQLVAFWEWYVLSKAQTIQFKDFDDQIYLVQITAFVPQRARKLSFTGRDPSVPHHRWTYTMTLEVYGFVSGDLADAGVTP